MNTNKWLPVLLVVLVLWAEVSYYFLHLSGRQEEWGSNVSLFSNYGDHVLNTGKKVSILGKEQIHEFYTSNRGRERF